MCLNTAHAKEVGYLSVPPVKFRHSRMKAMSTSEPAANQGILTVVSYNAASIVTLVPQPVEEEFTPNCYMRKTLCR